jgi:hypothetical protein
MHQRGAPAVTTRPEWHGFDKDAGIGENFGFEVGQAMKFAPVIGQIFQEYRKIAIRHLARVAACAGAGGNRMKLGVDDTEGARRVIKGAGREAPNL